MVDNRLEYPFAFQRTVLPNGIRVVTERIPYVRSVSVGFWFGTGSRNESPTENGISHLIEHLMFKGTANRTARQIAETFDAAGGQLNAFTSKEHTCYYARVLDEHFGVATDVISDMILSSLFAEADLVKEKSVVIEEIKMYEDSPDEMVHDLFTAAILDSHPLGQTVLGTAENVLSFERSDILRYLERWYTADNLVVSAAGNIQHEAVVEEIAKRLGPMRRDSAGGPDASTVGVSAADTAASCSVAPRDIIKVKDTEQVHLCLGTEGLMRRDPDKYPMFVLDVVLGGGMSSRLFQELREEMALVYSTYSYHVCFRDTGLFSIYAGTSPQNVDKVLEAVRSECRSLLADGITREELRRAKEQLKGSLMLSLESTNSRMSRIAKSELFAEMPESPDEIMAKVEAVTMEDVMRVARRLLVPEKLSLAAIGPLTDRETEQEAAPTAIADRE